jgi:predicted N-acetyltransferase YhbS
VSSVESAREAAVACVLLVVDGPYFSRSGFQADPARGVRMPGPVNQRRVLVRAFKDLGEGFVGPVEAR